MKEKIFLLIAVLFIGLAMLCGCMLWKTKKQTDEIQRAAEDLARRAGAPDEEETEGSSAKWQSSLPDFQLLKQINPDIIGWIYIPGTKINDPILQHPSDDSYYLHHSYTKEESVAGSIFLYSCFASDFSDAHLILFGHNMASGLMFGSLSDYASVEFAQEHPVIYLFFPGQRLVCSVYSAYSCAVEDETYQLFGQADTEAFHAFVNHTAQRSEWQKEPALDLDEAEKVITLSTCTDSLDPSRRFVVHCVPVGSSDGQMREQTE